MTDVIEHPEAQATIRVGADIQGPSGEPSGSLFAVYFEPLQESRFLYFGPQKDGTGIFEQASLTPEEISLSAGTYDTQGIHPLQEEPSGEPSLAELPHLRSHLEFLIPYLERAKVSHELRALYTATIEERAAMYAEEPHAPTGENFWQRHQSRLERVLALDDAKQIQLPDAHLYAAIVYLESPVDDLGGYLTRAIDHAHLALQSGLQEAAFVILRAEEKYNVYLQGIGAPLINLSVKLGPSDVSTEPSVQPQPMDLCQEPPAREEEHGLSA